MLGGREIGFSYVSNETTSGVGITIPVTRSLMTVKTSVVSMKLYVLLPNGKEKEREINRTIVSNLYIGELKRGILMQIN